MKLRNVLVAVFVLYLAGWLSAWGLLPLSSLTLWLFANPLTAFSLFLMLLFAFLALTSYLFGKRAFEKLFIALTVFTFLFLPFTSYITLSASAHKIKVVYLKELPDLYGIYRLIPLQTAYAYASDRLQIPTHTIYFDESYVYYINTTPIYNWLIEPEGLNVFVYGPAGAIFVLGDRYPPSVKVVREDMVWGLHNVRLTPFFPDTLYLELLLRGGFGKKILFEDAAEVMYKGKIVIVVPRVSYEVEFPGSFPVVDGFYLVFPNGTIKFVKEFKPVPALPEEVAREWVERLQYENWVQALFFHNTFVIRDVGTNPQPYLLPDAKGRLWWVFVAEPPGNSYAAYKIIMFNAMSTEPVAYVYTFKRPQIGVSKVQSYIMKAHPNWNWNSLRIQEPMPVVINGTLYWKAEVTTLDGRGLISVEFLNAAKGTVISVPVKGNLTASELLKFLREKKRTDVYRQVLELVKKIEKELEELKKLLLTLENVRR